MINIIIEKTAEHLTTAWQYDTVVDWYSENSAPHEVNILSRFASAASDIWKESTAFYEVMIDKGRIDLLIISPEAILIVEGKTTFHSNTNALIRSLNEQIERIHGADGGVRRLIDERIPSYCWERWKLQATPPIYIVTLSWCNSKGINAWSKSEAWSKSLTGFDSGSEPFIFSGDEHYLLFKYRKSNGTAWIDSEPSLEIQSLI
ncbi:hypothetical protein [Pseudomonas sp. MF6776]|uniref:hypothetical protein n=1 Tax=Pseudomonas sp. MF6776 TaxID=2797534 RepID=UPI001909D8D9|nr:hypothetical protein [Pseudomonas sp. MF6776]MBK3465466.1 hypothetical protein [Pseudomonas sp. MF6776]